jgi:hypothetical protein
MPQAPLLNDGKTGDKIKVRIPAAQVIGHFQVLEPAILRENVALNSRRVPGAKGRLKVCTNEPSAALCSIPWSDKLRVCTLCRCQVGSIISIFDIRSKAEVKRARCAGGWFNLVTETGQDVVVEAEEVEGTDGAESRLQSFRDLTVMSDVEREHSEQQRLEMHDSKQDEHLRSAGLERVERREEDSVAFTESALAYHSNLRENDDGQARIDGLRDKAQMTTATMHTDEPLRVPRVTRKTQVTPLDGQTDDNPSQLKNPMLQDPEQETESTSPGATTFANPMLGIIGGDADEEDERDIDLDTQLDASAEELAHFDEANATRHLDASQHHDDYDAFMQQHLGDTD